MRRDECRRRLVKTADDLAACAAIENSWLRDGCYVSLAQRPDTASSVCDRVTSRKAACYRARAANNEPALCERVGSGPQSFARLFCYREAFKSLRSSDFDPCIGVTDAARNLECLAARARAARSAEQCARVALPEIADACLEAIAFADGDACLRIQDAGRRQLCAWRNWSQAKAPAICELVPEPAAQKSCADHFVVGE